MDRILESLLLEGNEDSLPRHSEFREGISPGIHSKKGALMKISISSQGWDLDSQVDPRFGRAAQFVIYDTEASSFEVVSNSQSLNATQGAGIKAAEIMSTRGVQVLITGHCGPKAFNALKAAGIEVISSAEGLTVAQALEKYKSGQFTTSNSPDATGHWK